MRSVPLETFSAVKQNLEERTNILRNEVDKYNEDE
jgi:hypothetical protein